MQASSTSENPDSVTDLLQADHDRLDAILYGVKREAAAEARAEAAAHFAEFRTGLERHIVAEEEVLFPVFEQRSGMGDGGPTAVMRAEHIEIRRLLGEVAAVLGGESEDALLAPMAALTAILLAHNGKEERILYPMTDRVLEDSPDRAELMEQLRAAL